MPPTPKPKQGYVLVGDEEMTGRLGNGDLDPVLDHGAAVVQRRRW